MKIVTVPLDLARWRNLVRLDKPYSGGQSSNRSKLENEVRRQSVRTKTVALYTYLGMLHVLGPVESTLYVTQIIYM